MRPKKIGCDGAGLLDEFGPNSWWAHGFTLWEILDDDAAYADLEKSLDEAEPVDPDSADWWKESSES
jgi:hypothetical protein